MQDTHQTGSPHLGLDEVHIWWASLDQPRSTLPERLALLSADEKARAQRFRFDQHRQRYIAGRACLCKLLGLYLDLYPARIKFEYSPLGKPALPPLPDGEVLQFNLSNSEDRALIAFRWQRLVGIDLEYLRPMPDGDDLARQFFCPPESALVHSLSGEARTRAFFELWTSKESLLKAMGTGLTTPINQVQVSLEGGGARLVSIAGDPAPGAYWHLSLFQPAPGYQAALAQQVQPGRVSLFNFKGA